jgi:hypothetical protein
LQSPLLAKLNKQHYAAVEAYLAELNEEQQAAAFSPEQHVRIIAGEEHAPMQCNTTALISLLREPSTWYEASCL